MIKKKSYNCTVCHTSWECYVFDEFSTPFSTCMYCFMDIENIIKRYPQVQETCALCDTAKPCHKIPLVNNPVNNHMFLCKECFNIIQENINTTKN